MRAIRLVNSNRQQMMHHKQRRQQQQQQQQLHSFIHSLYCFLHGLLPSTGLQYILLLSITTPYRLQYRDLIDVLCAVAVQVTVTSLILIYAHASQQLLVDVHTHAGQMKPKYIVYRIRVRGTSNGNCMLSVSCCSYDPATRKASQLKAGSYIYSADASVDSTQKRQQVA